MTPAMAASRWPGTNLAVTWWDRIVAGFTHAPARR